MTPSTRFRSNVKQSVAKSRASSGRTSSPYFSSPSNTISKNPKRSATAAAIATTLALSSTTVLNCASTAFVSPLNHNSFRRNHDFVQTKLAANKDPEPKSSNPKTKKKVVSTKKQKKSAPITTSFQPVWCGRFDDLIENDIPVHTLILGTHPSIKSLEEEQYFGHPQNAFWWIAGDCLGFRRDTGISPSTGKPYAIVSHVRYGTDKILSYDEQQKVLVRHGFALWDIVGQCRRPGSLDSDIYDEIPNPLREFAQQHHHSLKRIVFANGGTGCNIFNKHFKEWLGSGELQALPGHTPSEKAFSKAIAREEKLNGIFNDKSSSNKKIDLICAIGVSPAAASYSYIQKRDSWEEFIYKPGLADFKANSR